MNDALLMGVIQGCRRLYAQPSHRAKELDAPSRVRRRQRRRRRTARQETLVPILRQTVSILRLRSRTLTGFVPSQMRDGLGQRLTINQLHCVKMNAAFASYRVDRHDVRVMQTRCRLGFVLETLELTSVQGGRKRQHFEGDASIQR